MTGRNLRRGEVLRDLRKAIPEKTALKFDKRTSSGAHCYTRIKISSMGEIYQTVLLQNRSKLGIEVSVRSCADPQYRYKNGYNFGYLNPHCDISQILPESPHAALGVAYSLDGSLDQFKLMERAFLNDLTSHVIPWLDNEFAWIEENGEAINRVLSKIRISTRKYNAIRKDYDDKFFNRNGTTLVFSRLEHRTVKSCVKRLTKEGFLAIMPERWARSKATTKPNIEQLNEFAFELIHLVYNRKQAK